MWVNAIKNSSKEKSDTSKPQNSTQQLKNNNNWFFKKKKKKPRGLSRIIQSEKSQSKMVVFCYIAKPSWNEKMIEVETRLVVALGQWGGTGKREVGVAIKGERGHPCDDLYLLCANINILAVLRYCTIVILGELGKVYVRTLCITSHNCIWLYNYLIMDSLIFLKR